MDSIDSAVSAMLENVINGCFYEGVFFAVAFHFYLPYFSYGMVIRWVV